MTGAGAGGADGAASLGSSAIRNAAFTEKALGA